MFFGNDTHDNKPEYAWYLWKLHVNVIASKVILQYKKREAVNVAALCEQYP